MPTFISNLSVAKRLGLGFALVLLLSLVSILVGITRLNAVAEATRVMMASPIKTERLVSDWYRNIHTGVRRTSAIARSNDASLATYFAEDQAASTRKRPCLPTSERSAKSTWRPATPSPPSKKKARPMKPTGCWTKNLPPPPSSTSPRWKSC